MKTGNINDRGFSVCKTIAEIGEDHYFEILGKYKKEGKISSALDLRDSNLFRLLDIDFAFTTDGKDHTVEDAENVFLKKLSRKNWHFVEVKTDTWSLTTGNFFLEWLVHNTAGCLGCTRADKWIYYGITKGTHEIKKCWSIDVVALRKAIESGEILETIETDDEKIERDYIPHYCGDYKTENFAWKIRINSLVEKKIAKEIKIE